MKRLLLLGLGLLISFQVCSSQEIDTAKGCWLLGLKMGLAHFEPYEYNDPLTQSSEKSIEWTGYPGIYLGYNFQNPWELGVMFSVSGNYGDFSIDADSGQVNSEYTFQFIEFGPYYCYNFLENVNNSGRKSEFYQYFSTGYYSQSVEIEKTINNKILRQGTRNGQGVYWNFGLGHSYQLSSWIEIHFFMSVSQNYSKNEDPFDKGWADNFPESNTVFTFGTQLVYLFNKTFLKIPKNQA